MAFTPGSILDRQYRAALASQDPFQRSSLTLILTGIGAPVGSSNSSVLPPSQILLGTQARVAIRANNAGETAGIIPQLVGKDQLPPGDTHALNPFNSPNAAQAILRAQAFVALNATNIAQGDTPLPSFVGQDKFFDGPGNAPDFDEPNPSFAVLARQTFVARQSADVGQFDTPLPSLFGQDTFAPGDQLSGNTPTSVRRASSLTEPGANFTLGLSVSAPAIPVGAQFFDRPTLTPGRLIEGTPGARSPLLKFVKHSLDVGVGFSDAQPKQLIRTATDVVWVCVPDGNNTTATADGGHASRAHIYKADRAGVPVSFSEVDAAHAPGYAAGSTNQGITSTAIAIASTDLLHVAWVDRSSTSAATLKYTTVDTTSGAPVWGAIETIEATIGFAGGQGDEGLSLALDANDIPHVAYLKASGNQRVFYANRIGGTWSAGAQVDTDVTYGASQRAWAVNLAFDTAGRRVFTFVRGTNVNNSVDGDVIIRVRETSGTNNPSVIFTAASENAIAGIDGTLSILIAPDNTYHATYLKSGANSTDFANEVIRYCYSTDRGATWTFNNPATLATHDPVLGYGTGGNLRIWGHGPQNAGTNVGHNIYYLEGTGKAGAWSAPYLFQTDVPVGSGELDSSVATRWSQYVYNSPSTVDVLYWNDVYPNELFFGTDPVAPPPAGTVAAAGPGVQALDQQFRTTPRSRDYSITASFPLELIGQDSLATGKAALDQQYRTALRARDYSVTAAFFHGLDGQDALPVGDQLSGNAPSAARRAVDYTWVQAFPLELIAQDAFNPGEQLSGNTPVAAPRARDYSWLQSLSLETIGPGQQFPVGQASYDLPTPAVSRARDYSFNEWYFQGLIGADQLAPGEQLSGNTPATALRASTLGEPGVNLTIVLTAAPPTIPNGLSTALTALAPIGPLRAREYGQTSAFFHGLDGKDALPVGRSTAATELPPRAPARARDYSFVAAFPLTLVGRDAVYGAAGEVPAYDWQLPPRAAPRASTLSEPGVNLTVLAPTPTIPVGEQIFDLPTPAPPRARDYSFTASYFAGLIGKDALPAGHSTANTDLPPKAAARARDYTWLQTLPLHVYQQLPPGASTESSVVPPRGPARSRDYTFLRSLPVHLVGQDRIYGAPGEVPAYDWQLPPRAASRLRDYTLVVTAPYGSGIPPRDLLYTLGTPGSAWQAGAVPPSSDWLVGVPSQ